MELPPALLPARLDARRRGVRKDRQHRVGPCFVRVHRKLERRAQVDLLEPAGRKREQTRSRGLRVGQLDLHRDAEEWG